MTKVTKEKNLGLNDVINIETKEGNFYISFENDLNLYFSYSGNNVEEEDEYSFTIDKENNFLYDCFDKLYDSIESEKPFKYSQNLPDTDYVYPLSEVGLELDHGDGIIAWHSDDELNYDSASVLEIMPYIDSYIVTFKKSKSKVGHSAYSVCIKNGGSGYDPYNASFAIMYNALREHDFELDNKVLDEGYSRTRKR